MGESEKGRKGETGKGGRGEPERCVACRDRRFAQSPLLRFRTFRRSAQSPLLPISQTLDLNINHIFSVQTFE
jgi:hypothetical protein